MDTVAGSLATEDWIHVPLQTNAAAMNGSNGSNGSGFGKPVSNTQFDLDSAVLMKPHVCVEELQTVTITRGISHVLVCLPGSVPEPYTFTPINDPEQAMPYKKGCISSTIFGTENLVCDNIPISDHVCEVLASHTD